MGALPIGANLGGFAASSGCQVVGRKSILTRSRRSDKCHVYSRVSIGVAQETVDLRIERE